MPIIKLEHLRKVYGDVVAVDDVSFEVEAGEIFGMVGPNGAGKTTTIECIEGLRRPDGGSIHVLGLNPKTDGYALRERIGMQLQESELPDRIKVWEALDLYASFYQRSVDWHSLMEQLGLADKSNAHFAKLSGGLKQRLFIVLALLNDPELVFFDELTTGLDPQARRTMWDLVRNVRDRGKTVFLTTHYMEEAEWLCDRVAIIDRGRIIALDTPENLIRSLDVDSRVVFSVDGTFEMEPLRTLRGVGRIEQSGERVTVYGQGQTLVGDVVNVLTTSGVRFRDLRTEQPTLDDVFLTLTGQEMRD
ncbi:ABC transporter ATP-binding protein [Candidatus Poribacteria bacterium]|nr:ABC transporter ATP-binding protein [Candidatus Poribacteria bacterium]